MSKNKKNVKLAELPQSFVNAEGKTVAYKEFEKSKGTEFSQQENRKVRMGAIECYVVQSNDGVWLLFDDGGKPKDYFEVYGKVPGKKRDVADVYRTIVLDPTLRQLYNESNSTSIESVVTKLIQEQKIIDIPETQQRELGLIPTKQSTKSRLRKVVASTKTCDACNKEVNEDELEKLSVPSKGFSGMACKACVDGMSKSITNSIAKKMSKTAYHTYDRDGYRVYVESVDFEGYDSSEDQCHVEGKWESKSNKNHYGVFGATLFLHDGVITETYTPSHNIDVFLKNDSEKYYPESEDLLDAIDYAIREAVDVEYEDKKDSIEAKIISKLRKKLAVNESEVQSYQEFLTNTPKGKRLSQAYKEVSTAINKYLTVVNEILQEDPDFSKKYPDQYSIIQENVNTLEGF